MNSKDHHICDWPFAKHESGLFVDNLLPRALMRFHAQLNSGKIRESHHPSRDNSLIESRVGYSHSTEVVLMVPGDAKLYSILDIEL